MKRGNLMHSFFLVFLTYRVASLELLANYKYWKSTSNTLTYDYSGNSRHATIFANYMVTDRGLSPLNDFYPSFMIYSNPKLADYTLSFWMYNSAGSGELRLVLYPNSGREFWIYHKFNTNSAIMDFRISNIKNPSKVTTIDMSVGWDLHTIRMFLDSNIIGRVNVIFYRNLTLVHSNFLDTGVTHTKLNLVNLGYRESNIQLNLILYELWIHTDFSNISNLSNLLSIYDCPNSFSPACSPTYPKSMNQLGQSCPSSCTTRGLSCDKNLICIPKSKTECLYGLYDLESSECLFYCPNNSCICPAAISNYYNSYISFSCSCIIGYKKISDDPPACISINCITYYKIGYNYICETLESGYTLNALGECCNCLSGFTQVSSSPIVCVNISICLGYTVSAGDYKCSSCAVGYAIDSQGKCNKCDYDYVNVLDNPFNCALKIDNCSQYMNDGTAWKCQTCSEGYFLYEISINIRGCALIIESCADYKLDGTTLICNSCQTGFYLSESKSQCLVHNCEGYDLIADNYICSQCSIGYQIDSQGKCNKCSQEYVTVSDNPFTCVPKIENCLYQKIFDGGYICEECQLGYKIGMTGMCDECQDGYFMIEPGSLLCYPRILQCLDYEIIGEAIRCMICGDGYALDSNYECSQCEEKYIKHPQENSICIKEIDRCSEYEIDGYGLRCIRCELGYDLDDESECKSCSEGYTYSNSSLSECILNPGDKNEDTNLDSSDAVQEETISEARKERVKTVESSNSIASNTAVASTGISSMLSMDPNTLIVYLNTVQVVSLIQYLNITLPFEIRKQQESTSKQIQKINILSNISIQSKDMNQTLKSYLDDKYSFIAKNIYQFMTLGALVLMNLLAFCISRYARGKLKDIGNKILRHFKYNIYIQFYMLTFLDILYSAIAKLIHVIST